MQLGTSRRRARRQPRGVSFAGPATIRSPRLGQERGDAGGRGETGRRHRGRHGRVCTASWLQRDGHSVFLVEAGEPGHGASFGNAGCFNGSSVTPVAMPGVIRQVPRWLMDPLGPLALRWSYLPAIAPWLVRFVRAGTPQKVRTQARALRSPVGPTLEALKPLVSAAGAEDLVHRLGHLYVYRSAHEPGKGSPRLRIAARERDRSR